MWQEIINKAKDTLTDEIQNKAGLDQQKAQKSVELAGDSTKEVMLDEAKQGNVQQIMELFRSRNPSDSGNPIMNKISNVLQGKLVSQLGLSQSATNSVQSIVLPYIINLINQKSGGTDSAPSPQSLVKLLGGTDVLPSGIKDSLKKFGLG